MVDIQSATAEIRRGKKDRRKKPQDENMMACPIPQGGHKKLQKMLVSACTKTKPKPTLIFKKCSYVCVYHCALVVHNTAQNSSDNFPSSRKSS